MSKTGIIYGINGPVVYLKGDSEFKISEMVYVGKENLVGEVIGLKKGMTPFRYLRRPQDFARAKPLPVPAMPSLYF